jgi:hypothetical protein
MMMMKEKKKIKNELLVFCLESNLYSVSFHVSLDTFSTQDNIIIFSFQQEKKILRYQVNV